MQYLSFLLCAIIYLILFPFHYIALLCYKQTIKYLESEHIYDEYGKYLKNCSFLGIKPKDKKDFCSEDLYMTNNLIHGESKTLNF